MEDLAVIEQTAQVSGELANSYIIGSMTQAAGLPGGAQLQDQSVGLLADLGIEITAPTISETGAAPAILAAARASMARTAQAAGTALKNNPTKWAVALGIASAGVALSAGAYAWMTEDQQIRLEQIRQASALQAKALEGLNPEQRARVADTLAKTTFGAPPNYLIPVVVIGAIAGLYFFHQMNA